MNSADLSIAEKRKAIALYEQILGEDFNSSRPLTEDELEDIFRKIENMTDKTKSQPIPPHRNAIEPFQDLTRRVERLEREAKGFRMFSGSLIFLCVAGFIISIIIRLVNG